MTTSHRRTAAKAKSAPALNSRLVQWALDTAPWRAPDSPESVQSVHSVHLQQAPASPVSVRSVRLQSAPASPVSVRSSHWQPESEPAWQQREPRPSRSRRRHRRRRGDRVRKRSAKAKAWRIIRGTVKRHLSAKEKETPRPNSDSDSQGTWCSSDESIVLSSDPEQAETEPAATDPVTGLGAPTPSARSQGPAPVTLLAATDRPVNNRSPGAITLAFDNLTRRVSKPDDQCQ